VYGVWCMVYGVWCMVYGVWCMVYGVWCMVYGVWCMVYGILRMAYGAWCMVHGAWSMGARYTPRMEDKRRRRPGWEDQPSPLGYIGTAGSLGYGGGVWMRGIIVHH